MPHYLPLPPHQAAADAIHRFVTSLDNGSRPLLSSSLAPNITMDLTPFNATGQSHPHPYTDRGFLIDLLISKVGVGLDTTHMASNMRVKVEEGGERAEVSCTVLAVHFRRGEGVGEWLGKGVKEGCVNGNLYEAVVVKRKDGDEREEREQEGDWVIEWLRITPVWEWGERAVMKVE